MNIRKSFGTVIALLFSLSAQADWSSIPSNKFSLLPPPAAGSTEFKEDFKVLLQFQSTRSQADCELSQSQQHPDFFALYGRSNILTASEMHKAQPLIDKSMNLVERISAYFKNKFKRPRPYSIDERVRPCVVPPSGAKSYPSSHAAMATIGACLMKELFPNKANELVEYGKFLSDLRVIVGVHHPSDIEAGKDLAFQLCERLLSDKEFIDEMGALGF